MRKLLPVLALMLLLCGCNARGGYETVMDSVIDPEKPPALEMVMNIPLDATVQVMESEDGSKMYFCKDYIMTMQTADSGDLEDTFRQATGFSASQLQIVQTGTEDLKRYECVWTAAGESGDQVGRICVFDDGNYHYILTVMADANAAGHLTENTWKELFASFRLERSEDVVNSGS